MKYFTHQEIKDLRKVVKNKAQLHLQKGNVTGIREWLAINILTSAGLRGSEVANLRCDDCLISNQKSALYIRTNKWGKTRTVQVPQTLKLHLKRYLAWKRKRGEPTGPDNHLLQGQRGPWETSAISQMVKKWLRHLGLYEPGKAVHSLRHSYAIQLCKKGGNPEVIKEQMGFCNDQQVVAYLNEVKTNRTIESCIKGLWGLALKEDHPNWKGGISNPIKHKTAPVNKLAKQLNIPIEESKKILREVYKETITTLTKHIKEGITNDK